MKYLNRNLSWLSFNCRVLDEADKDIPLADKIMFHGITFSNIDEFMMVRYPSAIEFESDDDLHTLQESIQKHIKLLGDRFNKFNHQERVIKKVSELKSKDRDWINSYFKHYVFSALQPITLYEGQTIIPSGKINIFVETTDESKDQEYVNYLEVPSKLDRFIHIPGTKSFVLIEDLIIHNLDSLFKKMRIKEACSFSILRSAEVYVKDDTLKDPYEIIQKTLSERNKAWITRLDVATDKPKVVKHLIDHMNLSNNVVICKLPYVHLSDLKSLPDKHFKDSDRHRKSKYVDPFPAGNIFDIIKREDRLVFHPYESYKDSVVRFIREAADDDNVVSIKITLYRVADKSRIIDALVKAASRGKQVTALVELKARFDEEHNIQVSNVLKEAGVNLVYGSMDLKTHSKVCLVTRMEKKGLRIYSHIGTGNYNESTAKLYTDYSYFTANQDTGYDLTRFFSLITSEQEKFKSRNIVYAPYNLRSTIIENIDREIKFAKKKKKARIIFKCNSLTDDKIADKLVEAAKKGVEITLIVRGACILRPMKRIKIYSIVGRWLEHSRTYVFGVGDRQLVYIGSADIMYRNLNRRNELLLCVEDKKIKSRILNHIDMYLKDTVNRREILDNYKYRDIEPEKKKDPYNAQMRFLKEAKKASD